MKTVDVAVRARSDLKIRRLVTADIPRVHALQRQNHDKWKADNLTDFAKGDCVATYLLEDEGELVAVVGAKIRAEMWITLDGEHFDPQEWAYAMPPLFDALKAFMVSKGIGDGIAAIPRHLRSWGNMLVKRFGCTRDDEELYRFKAKENECGTT